MSNAPNYNPTTNFANDEANNVAGRSLVKTVSLDNELANISTAINAVNTNLKLVQRDDGKFQDGSVEPYALAEQTRALLAAKGTPRGNWAPNKVYALADSVVFNSTSYLCYIPHTSTVSFDYSKFMAISGDGSSFLSAQASAASAASALTSSNNANAKANAASASATSASASALAASNSAGAADAAANNAASILANAANLIASSTAGANQAEAEAGLDNTKYMTPLRVAQAILARFVPTITVPIRQSILSAASAPLAIGSGLSINLQATANAYRVAIPGGMGSFGQMDYVVSRTADVAAYWSGLTASSTLYLFMDRNPTTGVDTGVFSTLPYIPFDPSTASPSTVNNQHSYDHKNGIMYLGNGTLANIVQRTAVGECVTGTSTVTSVTPYAVLGMVEVSQATLAANAAYSLNHNLGTDVLNVDLYLYNKTAELGYSVGDKVRNNIDGNAGTGTIWYGVIGAANRRALGLSTGNGGIGVIVKTPGGGLATFTAANWGAGAIISRGFK